MQHCQQLTKPNSSRAAASTLASCANYLQSSPASGANNHVIESCNTQDANRTILVVPIPGEQAKLHNPQPPHATTLQKCFSHLLHEKVAAINGRRCERCNIERVPYSTTLAFDHLPCALALHINRGVADITKNFRHVALPETLDMAPYTRLNQAQTATLAAAGGSINYRLVSVVVHKGPKLTSGHYVAYRRAPPGSSHAWECWDDKIISAATWNTVASQAAYLVFYECDNPQLLAPSSLDYRNYTNTALYSI